MFSSTEHQSSPVYSPIVIGYVDIPVGTLRDAGFLSEEIKNVETGENVSDDELVRVRFDVLDHLEYTYPADKGDTSLLFDVIIGIRFLPL